MMKSLTLLLLSFLSLASIPATAQISFKTWTPLTDSFPIVRIPVSVSDNYKPAPITPANFVVKEDGVIQAPLELVGCSGTSSAAIVFVVDTSSSMNSSVGGNGPNPSFQKFFNSFSAFIASIPSPSQLALVEFAVIPTPWPGAPRWFFNSNSTDTTSFLIDLEAGFPTASGFTDVDTGIEVAVNILSHSNMQRKAIILVTDDYITQDVAMLQYLQTNGITLYNMEVNPQLDSSLTNNDRVALGTGGAVIHAFDSTEYTATMLEISQLIFGEKCLLRYVSSTPCPWWKPHQIDVNLNYNGAAPSAQWNFSLASSTVDKNPPTYTVDSSEPTRLIIHAYDPFPCESGMWFLGDTAHHNFYRKSSPIVRSDTAVDTIYVIDSLSTGDIYYKAVDSAQNNAWLHIHYIPRPDTLPPLIGPAQWIGGGVNTMQITETRPWDRGIKTVTLAPGAKNAMLDSVQYFNNTFAIAHLRILNLADSASACIVATDSFQNSSMQCLNYGGQGHDTLPPQFLQDPIAEPRLALTGIITEKRIGDIGIQRVVVTPLVNTSAPLVTPVSIRESDVRATLTDSLFYASARVEAWDSAGNHMLDSMTYNPLPDTYPPQLTESQTGPQDFDFSATEIRAWDRGLKSLILLPTSTNATAATPVFTDKTHATLTVTITDKTQKASISVQAMDSAGHTSFDLLTYIPGVQNPLLPLGDSAIDFGSILAGTTKSQSVVFTNSNDSTITISIGPLTGDDSVFTLTSASPITIAPHASVAVAFFYHPIWLGSWKASCQFLLGTNPFGSVTMKGQSTGLFSLSLDTVHLSHVGQSALLTLSLDAEPKPVNLDSISFTVTYDGDFVQLGDFNNCPAGATDTGICLYNAAWTGGSEGNRVATITRTSKSVASTLSFDRAQIQIPFTTIIAPHDSTLLHFSTATASMSALVTAADGMITAGDYCGSDIIREAMNGPIELRIIGSRPNPTSGNINLTVESIQESDAVVSVVSALGQSVLRSPVHLQQGLQTISMNLESLVSGMYEIFVLSNGSTVHRPIVLSK